MNKYISKSIFIDLLLDIVYFPIWWYTRGLLRALFLIFEEIHTQWDILGVGIWLKNLFTPMYGMYDWESRIISFFVRLVQLIFRFILFTFWTIIMLFLIVIWIILPIIVIWEILLNFSIFI